MELKRTLANENVVGSAGDFCRERSAFPSGFIESIETVDTLSTILGSLGVLHGRTVLVHASLKACGYVCGGSRAVVEALLASVGREGTVVFPAFTGDNTDPAYWRKPPVVSEDLRRKILEHTPEYHSRKSVPWSRVGAVPQMAAIWENAVRSYHPQNSFVAIGANAVQICRPDIMEFDYPMAPHGVLGRLYDADAIIVFLGTSWETCTALHLTEHLIYQPIPDEFVKNEISAVMHEGQRMYAYYQTFKHITDDFEKIGAAFVAGNGKVVASAKLPTGKPCIAIPFKRLVDDSVAIMRAMRGL